MSVPRSRNRGSQQKGTDVSRRTKADETTITDNPPEPGIPTRRISFRVFQPHHSAPNFGEIEGVTVTTTFGAADGDDFPSIVRTFTIDGPSRRTPIDIEEDIPEGAVACGVMVEYFGPNCQPRTAHALIGNLADAALGPVPLSVAPVPIILPGPSRIEIVGLHSKQGDEWVSDVPEAPAQAEPEPTSRPAPKVGDVVKTRFGEAIVKAVTPAPNSEEGQPRFVYTVECEGEERRIADKHILAVL